MATPSSPQDFKKKLRVGEVVTLPSGLSIKVKGVDLTTLVTTGKVPNSLLKTVQSHLDDLPTDGKEVSDDEAAKLAEQLDTDELKDYFGLMDVLVESMAMEPKVYPEPKDEASRDDAKLYVDEISSEDKLWLFKWAQGGADQLKRFPGRSEASMAPMEESGSDQSAPSDPAGVGA